MEDLKDYDAKESDHIPDDIARRVRKMVRDYEQWSGNPIKAIREDFDFEAGRQWPDADREVMVTQNRPVLTFNNTLKFINGVEGTETNNRMGVKYIPSGVEDSPLTDLLAKVEAQILNEDADDENSDAFRDVVGCGYGWTSARMDYDDDLYGKMVEERVDPRLMGWDPAAKKKNLSDRRWHFEAISMHPDDAKAKWPEHVETIQRAYGESAISGRTLGNTERQEYDGSNNDASELSDNQRAGGRTVPIIRAQWFTIDTRMVFAEPDGGIVTVTLGEWKELKKRAPSLGLDVPEAIKRRQRVYHEAYVCDDTTLEEKKIQRFSYACMTGIRDKVKGSYFGLIRVARDPQMWTNKMLSGIVHFFQTAPKGPFVEQGAIPSQNMTDFTENLARADRVKVVADGAITQGRIKFPDAQPLPPGMPEMLNASLTGVPDALGLSLEFLGMAGRTQAVGVERSRTRAGLAVLGVFFKARRAHILETGRIRLMFLTRYVPDAVFQRVAPVESQLALPLLRQEGAESFDVQVDEAPLAPDQKMAVWETIQAMLPAISSMNPPPEFWAIILQYSPFPTSLVQELVKLFTRPNPAAERAREMEMAEKEAEIGTERAKAKELESQAVLNIAKAQNEGADPMATIMQQQLAIQGQREKLAADRERNAMGMQSMQAKTAADVIAAMMKAKQAQAPKETNHVGN